MSQWRFPQWCYGYTQLPNYNYYGTAPGLPIGSRGGGRGLPVGRRGGGHNRGSFKPTAATSTAAPSTSAAVAPPTPAAAAAATTAVTEAKVSSKSI